jgi:hypothetical protein
MTNRAVLCSVILEEFDFFIKIQESLGTGPLMRGNRLSVAVGRKQEQMEDALTLPIMAFS